MTTPYMPSHTPAGTLIEKLRGDAGDVQTRGQQIVDLASDMSSAWNLISRLVDDGADMEGKSIEKLRELCGKVSSDLSEAAELYDAVGPHILTYGKELETSKGVIDPLVADLLDLWEEYYNLSRTADTAEGAVPNEPDDDADADEQSAYDTASANADEKRGLATAKHADWVEKAGEYDTAWDSWFEAFDTAAKNIREGVSGKIEDDWKDDLRGALDFLANVLAVAGIVLAVLAIVVGGPIIMALAAIVAVATLAVALTRKLAFDDGSWWDVAFGVIGVIPFIGPAARTIRGLGSASGWRALGTAFGDDALRLTGMNAASFDDWASGLNALRGTTFADKAADFSAALFSGKNIDDWARMGSTGRDALATVGTVWVAQFQILGQIKDASTGSFSGSFDPDQNPFS
ncbi:DUF308 domain-containing protein [Microbacterium sp. QXD-8]|uniref:DUF308 domain-containing protein n=1 Tax=Microbacterium psychrotolerans TaxID=3068321 RepID=A0ABU0Z1Z9_9MICO|nr:DUF308 domain-containing protein [Microbacterium sp. QXD-8]MDQ7878602.1 DUF308 domain-containing protein [Microbacterium sp. QXD-8]